MAFGQADSLFVRHQRAVIELGRRHPERAIQQQLPGGGREQIGAAHHLGDPHRRVVHHDRKLVSRNAIVPPDDEIAEVLARDELLRPAMAVSERNPLAVRHAETPVPFEGRAACVIRVERALLVTQLELLAAGSWIHRLILALVRRRQRPPHVRPRASAGINEPAGQKSSHCGQVELAPLALVVWPERPATIRPFLPFKAEPFQVFEHGADKLQLEARGIQVLIAQHEHAAAGLGALLRNPERARVAEVQVTCRRRREAAAIGGSVMRDRSSHQLGSKPISP